MAREPHVLALRAWVELALSLPAAQVTFWNSRPNAPAATKPYVTIHVITEASDGDPDTEYSDAKVFSIQEQTTGLVSVQIFGNDHASLAKRLETSLNDPIMGVFFDNSGVKVTRSGGTSASYTTRAFDAQIEDRSERVFVWRRSIATVIAGIDSIESIETEGTFN